LESDIANAFGLVLRRLRIENGWTQERLAQEAGIQKNSVGWLERGEGQPSLATILKLSRALKIKGERFVSLVEAELEQDK
jgi:transcriptional regulator with XRE-family HTH domain